MTRGLLFNLIALAIFAVGAVLFFKYAPNLSVVPLAQSELSAASVSQVTPPAPTVATTSITTTTVAQTPDTEETPSEGTLPVSATTSNDVARIQDPYSAPPESFDEINNVTREALVNILCGPQGASSLNPISGSGVIIDPRGIILTNAHVAQYVLLSESPAVDLNCVIRTGSPAKVAWNVAVLYIPPIWVTGHANEILEAHPTGTGEHDYALLYVTGSANATPLPAQFPYLSVDTRPAIGFPGDQVLVGSYPAELVGGIAAQYDLYAASSITAIKQLLTFSSDTPDLLSLGGVIEAQGGSSGGAVTNEWGRLIGLIVTTSSGTTTADRDLRALTLSYISRDLASQTGEDLNGLLQGDPASEVSAFSEGTAPELIGLYLSELSKNQ